MTTSQIRPPPLSAIEALEAALAQLFEDPPARLYACVEAAVMRTAYRYCDGNQLQTARLLGISRNVVRARLIQFGEIAGRIRGARRSLPPAVPGGQGLASVVLDAR